MFEVSPMTLDPIMDVATAAHCSECGETLAIDRCLNADCIEAGQKASKGGATRKFQRGTATGPMFSPRAWTLGGRVD